MPKLKELDSYLYQNAASWKFICMSYQKAI